MTEYDIVQAISINLLRIAEWHYKDSDRNAAVCKRYLDQSKQLSKQVTSPKAVRLLTALETLSVSDSPHTAERFLTLGVLLQHPQRWM